MEAPLAPVLAFAETCSAFALSRPSCTGEDSGEGVEWGIPVRGPVVVPGRSPAGTVLGAQLASARTVPELKRPVIGPERIARKAWRVVGVPTGSWSPVARIEERGVGWGCRGGPSRMQIGISGRRQKVRFRFAQEALDLMTAGTDARRRTREIRIGRIGADGGPTLWECNRGTRV